MSTSYSIDLVTEQKELQLLCYVPNHKTCEFILLTKPDLIELTSWSITEHGFSLYESLCEHIPFFHTKLELLEDVYSFVSEMGDIHNSMLRDSAEEQAESTLDEYIKINKLDLEEDSEDEDSYDVYHDYYTSIKEELEHDLYTSNPFSKTTEKLWNLISKLKSDTEIRFRELIRLEKALKIQRRLDSYVLEL